MEIINERNSEAYKIPFLKAKQMIDDRGEKSHVVNDADIICMILEHAEPFYEDYEAVCGRFPHENMMLRMTWRRQGILNSRFMQNKVTFYLLMIT